MKRIFAAFVLSLLILLLCACGRAVTYRSVQDMQNSMQEIENALTSGEIDLALQKSEDYLQNWEAVHGNLCLFLQHAHLDPLERIFAVLPHYIEEEEYTLAFAECRTVRTIAEHLLKSEQVTLENIL